tara:strand:- start:126 stop:716 length:591 start_codon:yes stop_codon:yes gene_type:complete
MPHLITKLIFGEINTIAIPKDVILMFSLLIVFLLIGYFFNSIISNDTNRFAKKIDDNSNLELVKDELEDQLTLEANTLEQKRAKKLGIKTLNFIPPSKLLRLTSLAVVAMGGASLLGLQHLQKSYQGMNTSRADINQENQSTKSPLSIVDLKPYDKTQPSIKKISYINSLLTTSESSQNTHEYKIKEKQIENNFSF